MNCIMWGRIMNIDVSTYKDENSKTLMYMSEEKVRDIIEKCTDSRFLGVFGEKTVNVLKVNLMLDGILQLAISKDEQKISDFCLSLHNLNFKTNLLMPI